MPTFSNTFTNGMKMDIDGHLQQNTTYRFASGGRLMWNRSTDRNKSFDENIKSGNTLAFGTARGNKYEISLCPNYKIIGSIDTLKGTVIFSTDGKNSEIGWLELNDNIHAPNHAKYYTRYNDINDPNGDLLNFHELYYIHGFQVFENEFKHSVYFTDGYNEERTINLALFFDDNNQPYHPEDAVCGHRVQYPKHLSVHAFSSRMDVQVAKMKFQKRIPGKMKSGQVQLVYKYASKNGHESVWSELSRPVWISDQKLDGNITIDDTEYIRAYQRNHHNRTMGASNIMTEEGLRWELRGLDTRWDQVKVGFVYFASHITFQEAIEYKTYDITTDNLIVDLESHTGISITKADLNQQYETILSVGTIADQENRYWAGNIELIPEFKLDTSSIKISPTFRYFTPDETIEPTFEKKFNPATGRDDGDPLTNTQPNNTLFTLSNFTNDTEVYGASGVDYNNYKGQLFSHLFKGKFRGETYTYAIVGIDRKGIAKFAQHITDFTFPNQFDEVDADGNPIDCTLARQNVNNTYSLRAMGAMFSGIEIPHDLLYDKFGKLNIVGFKIVRTARIDRIACQGVLTNCISTNNRDPDSGDTEQDRFVQPLLGASNEFSDTSVPSQVPNSFFYKGAWGSTYFAKFVSTPKKADPAISAPYYFNFFSPDILIEEQITDKMKAGQFQPVGFGHKAYSEWVEINGLINHQYTKNYKTYPFKTPVYYQRIKHGRPQLGAKSRIGLSLLHTNGIFDIYEKFDPERADIYDYRADVWAGNILDKFNILYPGPPASTPSISASQMKNSVILKLKDFSAIDFIESSNSRSTFPIVNWLQTPDNYYSNSEQDNDNTSSLDTRRYFSTGHIQPITEDVLNKVEKTFKSSGEVDRYIFNNVEVWGGDCYVNLFAFSRLQPEFTDCNKADPGDAFYNPRVSPPVFPDYSISNIIPIESKYNLALLYGRKFDANCVNPQVASCGDESRTQFSNGINIEQPASWDYNEVLLLEESTKFYFAKPPQQKIVSLKENGLVWSPLKVFGERIDSYRQRLPLDQSEVTGQYGAIQRFGQAFNSLYVLQTAGFSQMQTKLRTVIPTDDGEELSIASGAVFGGSQYISRIFGTQHKNSFWQYDNSMGWVDAQKGKLIVFSQNGVQLESDEKQQSDALTQVSVFFDRQVLHDADHGQFVDIIAGVDQENQNALTTFHYKLPPEATISPDDRKNEMTSRTLVYGFNSRNFEGYLPVAPHIYVNTGRYLLSNNPRVGSTNQLWLMNHGNYGKYFDLYYPTILEFIVNPSPGITMTFNNGIITTPYNSYDRISRIDLEIEDNKQSLILSVNNGTSILRPDNRVVYEESSLFFPLEADDEWNESITRLRGKYLKVRIVIDNSLAGIDGIDKMVSIDNFQSIFSVSYPVTYKN